MMSDSERRAFARCIRSLSTEDAACQLLEAYERRLEDEQDPAPELTGLEQLVDWSHPTLMQWALSHPEPEGAGAIGGDVRGTEPPPGSPQDVWGLYDASALVIIREARLLGDLSRAVEQAINLRDGKTMHAIVQALARTWVRVRGEQLLGEAFDIGDA